MTDTPSPKQKPEVSNIGLDDLASTMKQGMRCLASGVTVVATRDEEGNPQGMTVTAVNSLSDAPPSLLVCLHRETGSLRALKKSLEFSVNVLNSNQQSVSDQFAFSSEGENRFSAGEWKEHEMFSSLYLDNALTTFFCKSDQFIEYGSHCIVIGQVAGVLRPQSAGSPIIYYDAGYRTLKL